MLALLPLVGLLSGPAYAPILFTLAAGLTLADRRWPSVDRPLAALAVAFLLLCAVELPWSVAPALSAQRLAQTAGIWLACLALLALAPPERGDRLFALMFKAVAVGVIVLAVDSAAGYPLQRLLTNGAANAPWKYNRGLIALVLLAWPLMQAVGGRRAVILAIMLALALFVGLSSTGLVAFAGGGAIWLSARRWPRFSRRAVGAVAGTLILILPWLMRLLAAARPRLAGHIKPSGLHRLEIWDYMSARILERPLTGWGLGAAKAVPIRSEEMANYVYVSPDGVYPHNQWIEAWLETGLPGVLLGLGLLALALRRADSPYRLAAVAAALIASMLNFEITTDSWWAALAATALLFQIQTQLPTRKI